MRVFLLPLYLFFFSLLIGCSTGATQRGNTQESVCSDGVFTLNDDFEGGNMGRCEVLDEGSFRLYLSPEDDPINNSPWYAFSVSSGQGALSVELRYELHGHRYEPKLTYDRQSWRALDKSNVGISEDGTSVVLSLDVEQAPLLVCGQELFVQSDYETWLSQLSDQYGATLSTIGSSAGGRPIYLLETDDAPNKDTLILLGRAHPPEVTGALAMRHFVDHLFGQHQAFLKTHNLFIVPLLNPDGVALGHWRHGLGGLDLNRDWGPFSQPENVAVLNAVNERVDQGMRPRLMLDFHSTHRNVFYTQTDEEDVQLGNFTHRWFDAARALGVYPFEHAQRHNQGRPTSKNYFHSRFKIPAITFELADSEARSEIETSSQRFADALVNILRDDIDIRIIGGTVVDGTPSGGDPNRIVDIVDDKIVYVGPLRPGSPRRVIDATNKIVAPGFIDPHTHAYSDLSDPNKSSNDAYTFQGVSTVFVGNDGGDGRFAEIEENLSNNALGTNVGVFAGHGSIRRQVVGNEDRAPTPEELRAMQGAVAQDMRAGAYGLSSGLFYAPGSFAETDEVIELAKVAASFGGVYESHIRDEADYSIGLLGAVQETIEIGRKANIPVHIAHIKALGPSVHGQSEDIVRLVEEAQAEGLTVTADQYPWLASGTRLSNALIPRRVMTGGAEGLNEFLSDTAAVQAIQAEMQDNLRRRDGAGALLITGSSPHQGQTLAEIAEQQNTEPTLAAVEIVRAGDPAVASFMMNEDDLRRLMVQEWVVTSSDGSRGHPRKFASFPEKYSKYVKSEPLLDLATFVHKSSGATAEIFGICDRGFLREGMQADVLIFDPEDYQPSATYEHPERLAKGVEHLIVNGVTAISEGKVVQPSSGRLLNARDCLEEN